MFALSGADPHSSGVEPDGRRILRYLVPAALVALLVAMIAVIVASTGDSRSGSAGSLRPTGHNLPPYWTVHRGETYSEIAKKTGLRIDQLKTLNPHADPHTLVPGERLHLRPASPLPTPKRLGPRFWTVRSGESFGSIAARTGQSIIKLEQLNPQLKPTALQPGDRVTLRP